MNMNENKFSKKIILAWNIYLAFLTPTIVLMYAVWNIESDSYLTKGMASGLTFGLILAYFPLVIFGINWRMGSYFTIITQFVWFFIFSKLLSFFFQKESYAPIVYYCGLVIDVTALLWCIIIKVYKPLENEIYRYPWGTWMVPHYDDSKIDKILMGIYVICSIIAGILGFCVDNYEYFLS